MKHANNGAVLNFDLCDLQNPGKKWISRLDQNLVCELLLPSGTKFWVNSSSGYKACRANRWRRTPRDRIGSPPRKRAKNEKDNKNYTVDFILFPCSEKYIKITELPYSVILRKK
jgi:hypothetical protein